MVRVRPCDGAGKHAMPPPLLLHAHRARERPRRHCAAPAKQEQSETPASCTAETATLLWHRIKRRARVLPSSYASLRVFA
eukprot:2979153-Pleurochrysis_carterae.AAC.1